MKRFVSNKFISNKIVLCLLFILNLCIATLNIFGLYFVVKLNKSIHKNNTHEWLHIMLELIKQIIGEVIFRAIVACPQCT